MPKASELIEQLQGLIRNHGDLCVMVLHDCDYDDVTVEYVDDAMIEHIFSVRRS